MRTTALRNRGLNLTYTYVKRLHGPISWNQHDRTRVADGSGNLTQRPHRPYTFRSQEIPS